MIFWFNVAFAGASDPCFDAEAAKARSAEIQALYDEHESDSNRALRAKGDPGVLAADEKRIKVIESYDKKGALCTSDDKWVASWILVQGDTLARSERAYELALETMESHNARGPWLVGFTFDLKRTRGGYRQSYGTQTRVNERNQRCLIEVEPEVTDEDRAKYGIRPISAAAREILDMNGWPDDEPTIENLARRGLYCKPLAVNVRDRTRIVPPDQR